MSKELIVNSQEAGRMIYDLLMCHSRGEFLNVAERNIYDYTHGFVSRNGYYEYSDITLDWCWRDNGIVNLYSKERVNISHIVYVDYVDGCMTEWNVPVISGVEFGGEMDNDRISELIYEGVDLDCYPRVEVWDSGTNEILATSSYYCNHILAFEDAKRITKNLDGVMCIVYCNEYARTYTHDEIITRYESGYIQVDVNE